MEEMKVANQKIRIRLKGYDHEIVDQSTKLIVDTAQKTGAKGFRTYPPAHRAQPVLRRARTPREQGFS